MFKWYIIELGAANPNLQLETSGAWSNAQLIFICFLLSALSRCFLCFLFFVRDYMLVLIQSGFELTHISVGIIYKHVKASGEQSMSRSKISTARARAHAHQKPTRSTQRSTQFFGSHGARAQKIRPALNSALNKFERRSERRSFERRSLMLCILAAFVFWILLNQDFNFHQVSYLHELKKAFFTSF